MTNDIDNEDDNDFDYELPVTTTKKYKRQILRKLKALDDNDLWEVVKIFDFCQDCWDWEPEKCELRPIRMKLGLGECEVYQMKKSMEKWRKKRLEKQAEKSAKP